MYSTISEKIIQNWLDNLATNDKLNPQLVAALQNLAKNNELKNSEQLKQVINELESFYDKNEN